jgi:hypothetical protein
MSEWIGIIGLKAGLLILGFLISNITAYSAFRRYKILNNGKSLLSPLCFGALGMVDVWSFRKKEISDPEFQKYRMRSMVFFVIGLLSIAIPTELISYFIE